MKLPSKKLTISAVAALTVVVCGVSAYAMTQKQQDTQAPQQASAAVITDEKDLQEVTEPANTTTVVTEPTPAPVAPAPTTQEPAAAPMVVRSFEEIILDYPNMSTGLPGFPECAGYLKNAWPEKFTDANREENIRWVSTTFINVCAAIDGGPTRDRQYTLQRYWGR